MTTSAHDLSDRQVESILIEAARGGALNIAGREGAEFWYSWEFDDARRIIAAYLNTQRSADLVDWRELKTGDHIRVEFSSGELIEGFVKSVMYLSGVELNQAFIDFTSPALDELSWKVYRLGPGVGTLPTEPGTYITNVEVDESCFYQEIPSTLLLDRSGDWSGVAENGEFAYVSADSLQEGITSWEYADVTSRGSVSA